MNRKEAIARYRAAYKKAGMSPEEMKDQVWSDVTNDGEVYADGIPFDFTQEMWVIGAEEVANYRASKNKKGRQS